MEVFDVVVVGGGISGGLPAAAYLQKAGLSVVVVEAKPELGVFCPSHEVWPETLDSPHAAVNFSATTPAMEDLELERYGYRWRTSPVLLGMTWRDGTNCLICHDPELTAKSFAKHSQHDGEVIFELQNRVGEKMVEFSEIAFFSPHPDADKFERMLKLCSHISGFSIDQLEGMTGPELVESVFESDRVRQTILCPTALHIMGAPLARGQGAFAIIMSLFYTTGIGIGGNESFVEAVTRSFLDHGGTILTNCPVERIEVQDGTAKSVVLSDRAALPGEVIQARSALISNVGARKTLEMVGEETLRAVDTRLASKMKHWKTDERGSSVTNWLIEGQLPWGSADFDPLVMEAHLMYPTKNLSWDEAKGYLLAMQTNDYENITGGLLEILNPGVIDPNAVSPEGQRIIRAEEVFTFPLRQLGGPEAWDGPLADELLAKRTDLMEAVAPGFKERVLEAFQWTPLDVWRVNQAAIFGHCAGGDYSEDQWILDRMPYRMPINRLYMSNSVWPIAITWQACGYNAAQVVAEDLGLRSQPWWVARPQEYYLKNVRRLTGPLTRQPVPVG